jgi:hypothetical protein
LVSLCVFRAAASPTYQEKIMMDIHQILKLLPHRYPILVDRVLEIDVSASKH